MPQIGDIKKGKELGKTDANGYAQFLWHPCGKCKKPRWVRIVKGEPLYKVCKVCYHAHRPPVSEEVKERMRQIFRGANHPCWKGGRQKSGMGYTYIYVDKNDFFFPMAHQYSNRVLEHRLVMAKHLNRCLLPWEIVHHKNGVRDDNRIENLELLPNRKSHLPDTVMKQYVALLEKKIAKLEYEGGNKLII